MPHTRDRKKRASQDPLAAAAPKPKPKPPPAAPAEPAKLTVPRATPPGQVPKKLKKVKKGQQVKQVKEKKPPQKKLTKEQRAAHKAARIKRREEEQLEKEKKKEKAKKRKAKVTLKTTEGKLVKVKPQVKAAVATSVPDDFKPDETKRHLALTKFFRPREGIGGLVPKEKGLVPTKYIPVHSSELNSDYPCPNLATGTVVEFSLHITPPRKLDGRRFVRAVRVTAPGGGKLLNPDDGRVYVGGKKKRYTGKVEFFNAKLGFGFATPDRAPALKDTKQVKLTREELGQVVPLCHGLKIEFGCFCRKGGPVMAERITLPGGVKITRATGDGRKLLDGVFIGTVKMFHPNSQTGDIIIEDPSTMPDEAQKFIAQREAKKEKDPGVRLVKHIMWHRDDQIKRDSRITRHNRVVFNMHLLEKCIGANNVLVIDEKTTLEEAKAALAEAVKAQADTKTAEQDAADKTKADEAPAPAEADAAEPEPAVAAKTPASPKQAPSSPKQTAAPGSPKRAATPGSPKPTTVPGSPKRAATPGSPKPTTVPGSPKRAATPGSPKQTSAPASPRVAAEKTADKAKSNGVKRKSAGGKADKAKKRKSAP